MWVLAIKPIRGVPSLAALACWGLLAVLAGGGADSARAEVGFGATLASDYRLRGVSLSDRQPALSLQVTYDAPNGVYAGATAIASAGARYGVDQIGLQGQVGYALRTAAGPSLDFGLTAADYHVPSARHYHLSYAEAYAGISGRNLSAHLYYSPDYLGQDVQTLYLSLDATTRPRGRLRLFAHAGVLAPVSAAPRYGLHRPQYDLKAGVAASLGRYEAEVAWTHVGPETDYPGDRTQVHDALVISASVYF
jgi:uncharacterized protein (TIGR02001 family)